MGGTKQNLGMSVKRKELTLTLCTTQHPQAIAELGTQQIVSILILEVEKIVKS